MSLKFLVALAIFLVAFPSTLATQWTVGDSNGWTLGVNYATWASGKTFVAGDTLVFKYRVGSHNVVVLDQTNYNACTQPSGATPLTSGDDIITLTAGNQWYICSIPGHCSAGMKLAITVSAAASPVQPPPPPPSTVASPPPPSASPPPPPTVASPPPPSASPPPPSTVGSPPPPASSNASPPPPSTVGTAPPPSKSSAPPPPPPAATSTATPPATSTTAPAPSAAPGIVLSQWHAWFAGALSILIMIIGVNVN